MENKITTTLTMEKATKNCIKFAEIAVNEFVPEKIGTLYVQKSALAEFGYSGGTLIVEVVCGKSDGIVFVPEKTTKNCVKFTEVVASEFVPEKIGSIYLPKSSLAEIGYTGGEITVSLAELVVTEK